MFFFQSVTPRNSTLINNIRGRLSILCQWQFIAIVLPLLAVLFFLLLAAVYIRASYGETVSSISGESSIDQTVLNVRNLIEQETVSQLCSGGDKVQLESSMLMEQLWINQTVLDKVAESVMLNPQWGISVEGSSWSTPGTRLPIWCSIKTYLWNVFIASVFIISGETSQFINTSVTLTSSCILLSNRVWYCSVNSSNDNSKQPPEREGRARSLFYGRDDNRFTGPSSSSHGSRSSST